MDSLSFTNESHPEWDKKITSGLHKECEGLTGPVEDFKTQKIYVTVANSFAGGLVFELHGDILWIDSIWVEPTFRKKGLGKQLLEKALVFATQNNVQQIQLNTYFSKAHAFFLTCGFEDVAVIPNWKWGLTCYLMRRMI